MCRLISLYVDVDMGHIQLRYIDQQNIYPYSTMNYELQKLYDLVYQDIDEYIVNKRGIYVKKFRKNIKENAKMYKIGHTYYIVDFTQL